MAVISLPLLNPIKRSRDFDVAGGVLFLSTNLKGWGKKKREPQQPNFGGWEMDKWLMI